MDVRSLRIALISEHASPLAALGGVDAGGQNVYVAHLARCLARAGHRVDVFTRRDAPCAAGVVQVEPGMRVLHLDAGPAAPLPKEQLLPHMDAFGAAALQRFRHGARYDVVHANFFMSGLVGLRLKQRLGIPLVVTFHALGLVRREHQGTADGFPPEREAIERHIVRFADRVVAECPQDRSDLLRLYDACAQRIAMVPCGVDPKQFAPGSKAQARRALGLRDDEFVVLQLGRMVPRKGVDTVIRALACMDPAAPVRLLVVGGSTSEPDERATPEIGRLRAVARECGVAERVTFTGQRQGEALRACYVAADVFVSTPWYEPFGITPLEAMACARPVIGSAVGGIRYSVVHGVTGYLVPPRDPPALARRLEALRADPAHAEALGRAGMRRVRSRFTWERVAAELLEVYREVVRRRGRAGSAYPLPPMAADGARSAAWPARRAASERLPGARA
ncbi:MAG: glycosyltransferase [Burkholderiaceae bacterium]|nr:glycosyltransferase [Burkholderiaceae bacterium]